VKPAFEEPSVVEAGYQPEWLLLLEWPARGQADRLILDGQGGLTAMRDSISNIRRYGD